MIIDAVLLKDKVKFIKIDLSKCINPNLAKKKLQIVHNQIVDRLKKYKEKKLIKSIYIPRDVKILCNRTIDGKDKSFVNKKKTDFQKELDELVKAKKEIKKSLKKINTLFN